MQQYTADAHRVMQSFAAFHGCVHTCCPAACAAAGVKGRLHDRQPSLLWTSQQPVQAERPGDLCCCLPQEADLLAMERTVLNSLGFRVNAPTAYTFWSIFRMSHAAADETSSLALYLTVRPAGPVFGQRLVEGGMPCATWMPNA